MNFTLRIARRRPRGGMDTSRAIFDAPSIEEAVTQATELTNHILDGKPGIAVLTSTIGSVIWSYRHKLPAPTEPLGLLR